MGLPLFFLLKDSAGTSMAAFAMIIVMLPCFLLAMYEKHGQPLEVVIKNVIQTKFIRPKERPYQTENFYVVIEKQRKLEKEVWQTRCEFNAYCKRTLRNELIDACRESRSRQKHEVNFSDLAPHEEKQLYTVDRYFVNEDEDAFCAGGLKITAKLLAEAMRSLPEEKRQAVLLYYFFSMTDTEIAELMKVPRSTVQYRRTSSFELLKRYLEERADEWNEL